MLFKTLRVKDASSQCFSKSMWTFNWDPLGVESSGIKVSISFFRLSLLSGNTGLIAKQREEKVLKLKNEALMKNLLFTLIVSY